MLGLPQELEDQIFLYLDFKDLEATRPLQSEYVKRITKYQTLNEAIENKNDDCLKYLLEQEYIEIFFILENLLFNCIRWSNISAFNIIFLRTKRTSCKFLLKSLVCISTRHRNSKFLKHIISLGGEIESEIVIEEGVNIKNVEFLNTVLELGGNLQISERYALLSAVNFGQLKLMEYLVQSQNYDVNFKEGYPLITTLNNKNYEMCKLLLELHANPNLSMGYPLKFAEQNGLDIFVKLLKFYGASKEKAVPRQRLFSLNEYSSFINNDI